MTRLAWLAFAVLVVIASAYGWLAVQWQQTEADVRRITRVVEGTPGEKGEPGEPGVGIKQVIVRLLGPDAQPYAIRRAGGLLTLYLPRPEVGPRGPAGRNGGDGKSIRGPRGIRGEQGPRGPVGSPGKSANQAMIAALVNAFMRSHTFVCTRSDRRFECRVQGGTP